MTILLVLLVLDMYCGICLSLFQYLCWNKNKNDPNLLGYWICDEPFPNGYVNIERIVKEIKKYDKKHLFLINIGDNEYTTKENLDLFFNKINPNIISFDYYNFLNKVNLDKEFEKRLLLIHNESIEHNINFYTILQAVGTKNTSANFLDWKEPNIDEFRWLVYKSLSYGSKGIIWFHWDAEDWSVIHTKNKKRIILKLKKINNEIKSLSRILSGLSNKSIYNFSYKKQKKIYGLNNTFIKNVDMGEGDNINISLFFNRYNEKFLFITNNNYKKNFYATFKVKHKLKNILVFDIEKDKWKKNALKDLEFELKINKGGGKVLKLIEK